MLTAAFLWIYVLHLDLGLTTTTSFLTFADSIGLVRSNPVFGLGVVLMIFSLRSDFCLNNNTTNNCFVFIRAFHRSLFWFCTDGYGFQEPRVQMVCGYGFHIIAVGAWMVPEKLGLLRSGLRSLVKSSVWLRCGLRFQVKSAGRFRSGLQSTSFVPNCDIFHAFKFRYAFTATYKLFYISTSTVSPAAASCADCTSWRHWLRLSCCVAMTALYF